LKKKKQNFYKKAKSKKIEIKIIKIEIKILKNKKDKPAFFREKIEKKEPKK
jgi:hypothetical protein